MQSLPNGRTRTTRKWNTIKQLGFLFCWCLLLVVLVLLVHLLFLISSHPFCSLSHHLLLMLIIQAMGIVAVKTTTTPAALRLAEDYEIIFKNERDLSSNATTKPTGQAKRMDQQHDPIQPSLPALHSLCARWQNWRRCTRKRRTNPHTESHCHTHKCTAVQLLLRFTNNIAQRTQILHPSSI